MKSTETPPAHPDDASATAFRNVSAGYPFPGRASSSSLSTTISDVDLASLFEASSFAATELLSLPQVEDRVRMKRSNIYRLIQLGLFPAPIRIGLGGSKWVAAEIDEYLQRKRDERDRQRGQNKFAPRPAILGARETTVPGSSTDASPAAPPPSTVRMLSPELVEALRTLKVDIPELRLDPAAWNVSLAVVKVELPSPQPPSSDSKRRNKR